ncbi:MAG: glycogen operon protein [Oceanicoccus sp.]|jgi:glycogen operon protein
MGVDGFRFDLAPIAGRDAKGFDPQASFFQTLSQDPQLAKVKLIAEPWDIGPGGYQLGHFPSRWSEWNDNYRDTVRQFWRRDPGQLPTFARRLHGSSDIFEHGRRRPTASINYLASHDGFTLNDLVSYQNRHNLANGEDNRDGHRENLSENFGVEGDSENPEILAARRRQQRNMLATLMLSQGVPMFTAGDEMLRSQQGNNNAYCQDNELNWLDWEHIQHSSYSKNHQQFVRRLLEIRNQHPVLTHDNYIHSPAPKGSPSIHWLSSDGTEMRDEHWQEHHNYFLGYQLKDPNKGTLLAIFNNGRERPFMLPKNLSNQSWQWLINTAEESGFASNNDVSGKTDILIAGRSVAVLSSIKEN